MWCRTPWSQVDIYFSSNDFREYSVERVGKEKYSILVEEGIAMLSYQKDILRRVMVTVKSRAK